MSGFTGEVTNEQPWHSHFLRDHRPLQRILFRTSSMQFVGEWRLPDSDNYFGRKYGEKLGLYQHKALRIALSCVVDRRTAVDAGGHIGTSAKLFSSYFERVISFEPAHDTFECLAANMAAFECNNVECRNQALSASPGRASLVAHERQPGNVGARSLSKGDDFDVIPLDELKLSDLGFLKIDAEGAEPLVLQGGENSIRSYRPVIIFENKGLWSRFGQSENAPQDLLKVWGASRIHQFADDEVWGWHGHALGLVAP